MASVRPRANSQYWTACITLPNGKRWQFATGLKDKDEALAAAHAAETAARRHEHRPEALLASLLRLADEYRAEDSTDTTAPGLWIRRWAEGKKGEVSKATLVAYTTTATETASWLDEQGIKSFAGLNVRTCKELRNWWAASNSPPTVNKKMKHLRQIFGEAIKSKLLDGNPAEDVAPLAETKTVRREFSSEELKLLLAGLSGEWLGMAWLALNTGQRINDLAILKRRAFNLEEQTVEFFDAKTKKTVALPLLPKTLEVLRALPMPEHPAEMIFPQIAGMSAPRRSNAFRDILAGMGMAKRRPRKKRGTKSTKRETSELSFHSFRHTATTWLKSAGVSDSIARAIIGHDSVAVSRKYTHFDMATMREAMGKVAQFQELGS